MSIPSELTNVRVFIENVKTGRYLFPCGDKITGDRGSEGGWLSSSGFESPKMVGADANYYNRAYFTIVPQDSGNYLLENENTKRYCFSAGDEIKDKRGAEHGWKASSGFEAPCCVGSDANYYNRALWKAEATGEGYIFENVTTKRYLFADGDPIGERGAEKGWLESSGFASPDAKGADSNYYGQAVWKIVKV